jgi:hypothetical protein
MSSFKDLRPKNVSELPSGGSRVRAIVAMRDRASSLRRQADKWDNLARSLEEIEKYAQSQSKDGEECGPHIGVGSAPEQLLWELASRPIEFGL